MKKGKLAEITFVILLHTGAAKFTVVHFKVNYKGTVDENGKACGWGTATSSYGGATWTGTWRDNLRHGLGKKSIDLSIFTDTIPLF